MSEQKITPLQAAQAEIASLKVRIFDTTEAYRKDVQALQEIIANVAVRVGAVSEDDRIAVNDIFAALDKAGLVLPEAPAEFEEVEE